MNSRIDQEVIKIDEMDLETSSPISVPYPEQFDFYWPESWPSWLKYFERYLSLQKLTSLPDFKKIELLCYSMGPISDKILMRIFPEYENCSYEIVKQTLNKYFSPHCNICNGLENFKINDESSEFVPQKENLDNRQKMYRYKMKNLSNVMDDRPFHYSPEFQLHKVPWQLLIRKRICDREQTFLSISLWPRKDGTSIMNDKVVGELRLLSQNLDLQKASFVEKISHVFHSATHFWESTHFMKWEAVLKPENGFIKDDSIILEVEVQSITPED